MIMQVLNRLDMEVLDDFEEYRRRAFSYLYFCEKCARSYDSKEEEEKCRHCGSGLKALWSMPGKKKAEKVYRYYCTACEKNYVSGEKPAACEMCGSGFVHSYLWEKRSRDALKTGFSRALTKVKNIEKLRFQEFFTAGKGGAEKKHEKAGEAGKTGLPAEKSPAFKQSIQKAAGRLRKLQLGKNREELPTQ